LRLFTPYGPWDDPRRLIPYIIKSLLHLERPKLLTPSSVRDFIFIEDVLDAYIKVLEADKPRSGIFNIGSGVQHTVSEVAEAISGIVDNGIEPEWGTRSEPRSEPESWVADVGKAAFELGWVPSTSLEEGLSETVAWFRQHLDLYPQEKPLP
jgi:nucleoside-diphosphate-sugar epimerase